MMVDQKKTKMNKYEIFKELIVMKQKLLYLKLNLG